MPLLTRITDVVGGVKLAYLRKIKICYIFNLFMIPRMQTDILIDGL